MLELKKSSGSRPLIDSQYQCDLKLSIIHIWPLTVFAQIFKRPYYWKHK